MTAGELRERTASFAVGVCRFARPRLSVPDCRDALRQLSRAAASVGANYRAACLARSRPEFRARLSVALEECDECVYWMEYLRDTELISAPDISSLLSEAKELVRILAASRRTLSRHDKQRAK